MNYQNPLDRIEEDAEGKIDVHKIGYGGSMGNDNYYQGNNPKCKHIYNP